MKISIITATYNVERSLPMTLNSISEQTFNDYEVIIVDGNSSDSTVSVAESYKGKVNDIRIYSEPDQGVYDAMNKGIKLAKGEYLYFLNAGDILYDKEVLSHISKYLIEDLLVYGNAVCMNSKGNEIPYKVGLFNKYRLAYTNICHQAIFYPKEIVCAHLFNLNYRLFADWEMNMYLWNKTNTIFIDTDITIYENGGISATQTDKAFSHDQIKLILKHLGIDSIVFLVLRKFFKWK